MRIAIDARHVADHFPGIGRYVYNLLTALAELDHGHTLVVISSPALPNTRHDLSALARFPAVELVATSARPFTPAEQILVPRLLRRLRADLYHAPYYVRPYAGLPCPSVTTLYDTIPQRFPNEISPRDQILFGALVRLAAYVSRRVIALSSSARADLAADYGIPADRIAVTPLAADPRFRPQPQAEIASVRAKYALPDRYVLSVSSNKPHKNLPQLVEAWALLHNHRGWRMEDGGWRKDSLHATRNTQHATRNSFLNSQLMLVIAGHWDPRYPEAHRLAGQRGVAESVRFLPGVAEADLPALYAGATLFAFPSLYEGFGLPPLEAMASGVPVLCGAASSLPEVVGDAALLVDPTSAASIADGLARLLADDGLLAALASAGLARAASFSWRRTAQATLAVYGQAGSSR